MEAISTIMNRTESILKSSGQETGFGMYKVEEKVYFGTGVKGAFYNALWDPHNNCAENFIRDIREKEKKPLPNIKTEEEMDVEVDILDSAIRNVIDEYVKRIVYIRPPRKYEINDMVNHLGLAREE